MSLLIRGLAAPFGVPTLIGGPTPFVEVLRPGCFRESLKARPSVPLLAVHDRQRFPVGVSTRLEETAEGLLAEFRVTPGEAPLAREAWEHVRAGALPGLSIGFRPVESVWTFAGHDGPDTVERHRVRLLEVSLVPVPAYAEALVTAALDDEVPTPHLDAALQWVQALKAA